MKYTCNPSDILADENGNILCDPNTGEDCSSFTPPVLNAGESTECVTANPDRPVGTTETLDCGTVVCQRPLFGEVSNCQPKSEWCSNPTVSRAENDACEMVCAAEFALCQGIPVVGGLCDVYEKKCEIVNCPREGDVKPECASVSSNVTQ